MKSFLIALCTFVCICACQNERKAPQQKVPLPNVPTEVAKQWVEAFYSDDYAKAVLLGTDLTRMMIDSVKKEMAPNTTVIAFKIYNMSCETTEDSSHCTYIYKEENYNDEEFVNLVKEKGQWLVNAAWEPYESSEVELEKILREEFEKIMEEDDKE